MKRVSLPPCNVYRLPAPSWMTRLTACCAAVMSWRAVYRNGEDIVREERLVSDNAQILARLDEEEADLLEILADSGRHAEEMREAFEAAAAKLTESETVFTAITAERAEAAAERQQLERAIRELSDRKLRLERQSQEASSEIDAVDEKLPAFPILRAPRGGRGSRDRGGRCSDRGRGSRSRRCRGAVRRSAGARPAGNGEKPAERSGYGSAHHRKITAASAAANGNFTPVAEEMTVERGFEAALGAALGDDLESALDPAAPAYWAGNGDGAGDPALPQGVKPLLNYAQAPDALRRGLAQIGVAADTAEALRLMPSLKAGQRLVTREGALFRWDGHIASADAPGAAALRLAQRTGLPKSRRNWKRPVSVWRRPKNSSPSGPTTSKAPSCGFRKCATEAGW